MRLQRRSPSPKVVPFNGYLHEPVEEPKAAPSAVDIPTIMLVTAALALLGGIALGSIATWQNPEQQQLRTQTQRAKQYQDLQKQICSGV